MKEIYNFQSCGEIGYNLYANFMKRAFVKGGKDLVEFWDILDENGNVTGRLHERGKPMNKGEYHLVVYV